MINLKQVLEAVTVREQYKTFLYLGTMPCPQDILDQTCIAVTAVLANSVHMP